MEVKGPDSDNDISNVTIPITDPSNIMEPSMEIKDSLPKSPLGLLKEVFDKANCKPTFKVESNGPDHSKMFRCTMAFGNEACYKTATCVASTKKEAKQGAARNFLLQVDKNIDTLLTPAKYGEQSLEIELNPDPPVDGNPIGELNEICSKLKVALPKFKDVSVLGKPHLPIFTVSCNVGNNIYESGRGTSKMKAKKVAASRALEKVRQDLSKGTFSVKDEADISIKLKAMSLSDKPKMEWNLAKIVSSIQNHTEPKITELKAFSLEHRSYLAFLQKFAKEHNFNLELMNVGLTLAGKNECIAAVSNANQCPLVAIGTGETEQLSKENAAFNLVHLVKAVLNVTYKL